ncbi:threonine--tRNA ligase [Pseudomonas sp. RW10S2]|uniref:threonine--tRNA ligase n=1 Tax=Pseudomonas sp. RW10S2 TaxID=459637 RepID=UPI0016493852|nr:threonine--tRNA ligase [Pseudomonas sp. RW10S2]MBC3466867.1 threonine--tRNA ligase [Pseudomonas sp. RW10S2]
MASIATSHDVTVRLPDGREHRFDGPATAAEALAILDPVHAGDAIAARRDGQLVDLSEVLLHNALIEPVTSEDHDGLTILRRACAQLLGHAVKQLYPSAQMAIARVTDDGFDYDIAYERPFTPDDLHAIEARMRILASAEYEIFKYVLPHDEAVRIFRLNKAGYKLRLLDDLAKDATVSIYIHQDHIDLSRGPVVPNSRFLKLFVLQHVSGAYWDDDATEAQLQRIHGAAWANEAQRQAHLHRLAEAEQRDHRRLGRELNLFHFEQEAPGAVFWHPRGWTLFQQLIAYLRRRQQAAGYVEVNTPDVMDRALWDISGHWQNYREHMFVTEPEPGRSLALKPMSCPGSVLMYRHGLKSYRDLPIRMSEFGKVHRYEPSGALHGLLRVRHFTQDDAHIYCVADQLDAECRSVIDLVLDVYRDFGFDQVRVKLSTRPEHRMGEDALWDRLEAALTQALEGVGVAFELNPGEGAFYGPKLEFVLRDAIGRDWQCGTLQVDMNLPERFGIDYIDEAGERRRPVMLHRAILGSLERFTGILIEHHAGKLPPWLAPVQAMILSISRDQDDYAQEAMHWLREAGLRVEVDVRNETIGAKIREHSLQCIPFLLVVGAREQKAGTLAIRGRQESRHLSLMDAVGFLLEETRAPGTAHRRGTQRPLCIDLAKWGQHDRGSATAEPANGLRPVAP